MCVEDVEGSWVLVYTARDLDVVKLYLVRACVRVCVCFQCDLR